MARQPATTPAFAVRVKKHVTLPVLKMFTGVPAYFKILTPITLGEKLDDKKEAAHVMQVLEFFTGHPHVVVCNTILHKELERCYPGEGYVGKSFAVTKHNKVEGKNYVGVTVTEIDEPAPSEIGNGAAAADANTGTGADTDTDTDTGADTGADPDPRPVPPADGTPEAQPATTSRRRR